MRSIFLLFFVGFISVTSPLKSVQATEDRPVGDETELLVSSLERIQEHSQSGRRWAGATLLGGSALTVVEGVITSGSSSNSSVPYWILSGILSTTGVFVLLFPREQEVLSQAFLTSVGSEKVLSASDRVRGEALLSEFASEGRHRRLVSAGVLGISGLAFGTLGISYQTSKSNVDSAAGSTFMALGAAYIGLGLAALLNESYEEEIYENYIKGRNETVAVQQVGWHLFASPRVLASGKIVSTLGLSVRF